jgi:hypothetical protein
MLLASSTARASVPGEFAVQGVLGNCAGMLQTTSVAVTVKLWNDQTATAAANLLGTPVITMMVPASTGLFTVLGA